MVRAFQRPGPAQARDRGSRYHNAAPESARQRVSTVPELGEPPRDVSDGLKATSKERVVHSVEVLIRTVSEANRRDHWAVRAKRVKEQRGVTMLVLQSAMRFRPLLPVKVTLTRIAPRRLDDDNLRSALKGVRDSVAEWLGVDDGRDDLVRYEYGQETAKRYAVRVSLEEV